jgi:hypothetical protein
MQDEMGESLWFLRERILSPKKFAYIPHRKIKTN